MKGRRGVHIAHRVSLAWLCALGATIVAGVLSSPVAAQDVPVSPQERRIAEEQGEKLAAVWTKRLQEADQHIRAGDGKKAVKITKLLARNMMDKILFGESAGQWIGSANLLRALGEAQGGHPDEAVWYWHVAQQLFPDIATYDLTEYGAAGELLATNPLRPPSFDSLPRTADPANADISPPKEAFSPIATYPYAQRETRTEPHIRIECRVGEDGKLSHPLVVGDERRVPFAFTALDQLRDWKVKPATRDGRPIAVLHELLVEVR
ncbi:MAG: energy transducer TonB [Acidobacteriota bacterium]|nr:energy transducer TonB [Acidobacteriota bacterium]